jgi:hypothetical protein
MNVYKGKMSKYNNKIPTFEGKMVAEYGLYIEDFADGYEHSSMALLYFPEINKVAYYNAREVDYYIFDKELNQDITLDLCFCIEEPSEPNLSKSETALYFTKKIVYPGFVCSPEELYILTKNNKNICFHNYTDNNIIIDNFPNIDFKKDTEIYYMNSYVMNQIYNDWYNNYYLTNKTLNWVQLYEDSMYNNIKKLDTYG